LLKQKKILEIKSKEEEQILQITKSKIEKSENQRFQELQYLTQEFLESIFKQEIQ